MRPSHSARPTRRLLVAASSLALLAAACGGADTTDAVAGELTITDARSRMSSMFTGVGAVFLDIGNGTGTDERLLGATVDPEIAAEVELHETFDADEGGAMGDVDDDMGDGGMGGGMGGADEADDMGDGGMGDTTPPSEEGFAMMGMRRIDALPIPAGETVSLSPGGYHLMLLELAADLVPGQEFELTLELEVAGQRTVTVTVSDDV